MKLKKYKFKHKNWFDIVILCNSEKEANKIYKQFKK